MSPPNCSVASPEVDTAVGTLLALACGLSLPGNAIALWTFFFRLKMWKPYTVYLFNLVVADLLLSVCLPFLVAFYLNHKVWGLNHTSYQVLVFLLTLSRGVGVAFLAAVALDRYLRVVHPRLKVNLLSPGSARGISGLVWLLMVALTHQGLFGPKTAQNSTDCPSFYPTRESPASTTWQEMFFFFQFLLPFGLILFCNTSLIRILQKRLRESHKQPRLQRAKALVTVVLLLFVLCFLPSILARALVHIFRGSQSCPVWCKMVHTSDIAGSLTCLHSALKPAIYCFSNPAFPHSYRKVLSSLRGRRKAVEPPSSDLRDSYS